MPRTRAQLDREITQHLETSAIAPMMKQWRAAIAAYRREIAKLEAGYEDWEPARRARDKLDKLIHLAAGYAPKSYGDPAIDSLHAAIAALPKIADARIEGTIARSKDREIQLEELRIAKRKVDKEYEWMGPQRPDWAKS